MPLPSALQLSVLSLSLLLEISLRLLFTVAATVCLCFGLIYFNLLGSNNISRPGVRKARKKGNGKIAGCRYRKAIDKYACKHTAPLVSQNLTLAGLKNSFVDWENFLDVGLRQTVSNTPLPLLLK